MATLTYSEKLKDPRWQKKRLLILQRDNWLCRQCFNDEETLNVHHRQYKNGCEPWDYEDDWLVTLCETCHQLETDNRKDTEKELVSAIRLKTNLSSGDLKGLAVAFSQMHETHLPEVVSSCLEMFLTDEVFQAKCIEVMFAHLRVKNLPKTEVAHL